MQLGGFTKRGNQPKSKQREKSGCFQPCIMSFPIQFCWASLFLYKRLFCLPFGFILFQPLDTCRGIVACLGNLMTIFSMISMVELLS